MKKYNITEKDINILNDKILQSAQDPQDEDDDCYMIDGKTLTKLGLVVTEFDYIMSLLERIDDDYLYKNHSTLWSKLKAYKGETK